MKFFFETSEENDKLLARKFVRIRTRRRISQQELSDLCGVSTENIREFEQTGSISLPSLIRIADALHYRDQLKELLMDTITKGLDEVFSENALSKNENDPRHAEESSEEL